MTEQTSMKKGRSNRRKRSDSEQLAVQIGSNIDGEGGVVLRRTNPSRTRSKKSMSYVEDDVDSDLEDQVSYKRSGEDARTDHCESSTTEVKIKEWPCQKQKKSRSLDQRVNHEKPMKQVEGRALTSQDPAERKRLWRKRQPYLACPDCNYRTKDKDTYCSHIAKHNPLVERFVCEDCDKTFRNKRSYRSHMRSHGSPDQLHQCTHCEFRTPTKLNWVQHLAVKHKVDSVGNALAAEHACMECNFTCMAEYQLKAHFSRRHQPEKPYKCEQCAYSSHLRCEVEKHMKIKHLNIRNYVCDRCGKTSQTKSGLERHKRTHTPGLKPFKCTMCDAAYADNRKLKIHLARHANNEKPFSCPLCTHTCHRRDNLQMHLKRIHKTTFASLAANSQNTCTQLVDSSSPDAAVIKDNYRDCKQSAGEFQFVEVESEFVQKELSNTTSFENPKTTSEFIKCDVVTQMKDD